MLVWRMCGGCLVLFSGSLMVGWWLFDGCLMFLVVCRLFGGSLVVVWRLFGGCQDLVW